MIDWIESFSNLKYENFNESDKTDPTKINTTVSHNQLLLLCMNPTPHSCIKNTNISQSTAPTVHESYTS